MADAGRATDTVVERPTAPAAGGSLHGGDDGASSPPSRPPTRGDGHGPRHLARRTDRPARDGRSERGGRASRAQRRAARRAARVAAGRPPRRGREVLRVGAAWVLVAPLAAWLAVRASGVGAGTWIETVIVLTPFAAAGSVAAMAVVAALRVRPALLAAAATCVGFGLVVAPLFVPGPRPSSPPTGPTLRVMTVNVQFGLADAERVVRLVRDREVAVLGVEELTPAFDEALREAGLDALLPYDHVEAVGGAEGTGLYSRYPVRPVDDGIAGRHRSPTALVAVPGAPPVQVSVVHPVPPVGDRSRGSWRATFRSLPRPGDEPLPVDGPAHPGDAEASERVHLLLGDFNATVDQPTMRALLDDGYVDAAGAVGRGWRMTWRFPHTPPLAIDHVLVDDATAVRSVEVHRVAGSDHRAVVATVRFPGA